MRHGTVRCVEQLVAELGEPLTDDGLMKTIAPLGQNHCPTSVEMGKGLNKYPRLSGPGNGVHMTGLR